MLKTAITILLGLFPMSFFAQNQWKEFNADDFQLKPDDFSTFNLDDGFRPLLNKDGSFLITGLKKNYLFDNQGNYTDATSQEMGAFIDSSIKVYAVAMPVIVRKGKIIACIRDFNLFYSISGEVHNVDLERVISYNHKGELNEKGTGCDSQQIISITDEEIIFYQHYFRNSEQTHPGIKPVKGVPYSFMRIGRCNLKSGTISYEFVFVDEFEKHKDIPVGDHPLKQINFIGIRNNHLIFGFTKYTAIEFYVRTGNAQEAVKVPESIVGYYSILAVDLKSYNEKELLVEQIKKPDEAFAFNLFPSDYGFSLSWSKRYDKTIFESHVDLIEVEEDLSVSNTSVLLPVEDLPLKSGMPINLQKVKMLDGSDWYALNARFANSKKRQDLKDQDPVIIMINKDGDIQYRDNSLLKWFLFSDAMDEAEENERCLPCLEDLNKEDFSFLTETPDLQGSEFSNKTFFSSNGKSVNYVQIVVAFKTSLRTGEKIRKKIYVRTGSILL